MKRIDADDDVQAQDRPTPPEGVLETEVSRRAFLLSLGALALTGCGADAGSSASSTAPRQLAAAARSAQALATTVTTFTHPGLLHTATDFTRMQAKYTTSPYSGSWNLLINNSHASLSYTPRPVAIVYRGYDGTHPENYSLLFNDVAAAYACALRWKISGDTAYADKAVQIMNAWSSTLTSIQGTTDADLAAGIYGYEFCNAAEIMRTYSGWAAADFTAFQNMMLNVFYPINHDFLIRHNNTEITHYWANWDLCNIASILAIGVLCDDSAKFNEAITYFQSGPGNGCIEQSVYYIHPGFLGQWQESGRDQGHNTLGIALGGAICEMAWNQGVDLYGYDNNRFLMGAEYVAKANLIQSGTTYYTVPYVTYTNVDVSQTVFSTNSQGNIRPCWALVYNHYVNRLGLAAPYSKMFALQIQPEGGGGNYGSTSGGFDQLGYGTLTCTRDAIASGAAPSGLKARTPNGQVELSWWGSAYATSYNVKRATSTSGPWTTLATNVTDLLTYTDNPGAGTWYYVVSGNTPSGVTADSNRATAKIGKTLQTYLAFNEATGTTVADSSGNSHTGTFNGGATWSTGRLSTSAVALDGSSGYVSLPANAVSDLTDFTFAGWVYWNASRNWERIFDIGNGTGRYMFLTPRSSTGVIRFAITVNSGHGELAVTSTSALPTGQWVHVAVTLQGQTATLYVNGTVAGTNTAMFLPPWQLGGTSQNWIGRSQYPADPYFNGKIDEFRFYRGALSAADIAALISST